MTGPEYVERQLKHLRKMAANTDDPRDLAAIGYALANLNAGPVTLQSIVSLREARKLSDTVFNYLGTRDADEVGKWIADARTELALARESTP